MRIIFEDLVEGGGRIVLPQHARAVLAHSPEDPEIRGRCSRVAWLLAKAGTGAQVAVDDRGRLYLPAWLRQACATGAVGTLSGDSAVLVASTGLLDGLGDLLTRGSGD